MKLEPTTSELFTTPSRKANIDIRVLMDISEFMLENNIEMLASSQIGVPGRFIMAREEHNKFLFMSDPRTISVTPKTYIYLITPNLNSTQNLIQRLHDEAVIEYELYDGNTIQEDMYGIRAALIQSAIGYLNASPPWQYDKLGDW